MKIVILTFCVILSSFGYSQTEDIDISISSDSSYLNFYQSGKIPLPTWIISCDKIKEVNLSQQPYLYDAIEQLALMHNVQKIIIQNAGVRNLPYNIYKIKNLNSIDLRGNRLKTLPYSIRYCSKLESINLDDNKMTYYGLVDIFRNVIKLDWLSLNNNQLESLPDEICKVNNLGFLYVYYNKLSKLPKCLFMMLSLKEFGLYNGRMTDSPSPSKNPINVEMIREQFKKNGLRVRVE